MQASTNVRQTSLGRRSGRGSRVLLAVLAMLLLCLFAILKGGQPAQAIIGGSTATDPKTYPFIKGMAQVWYTYQGSDGKTYTQLGCTGTLLDNNSVLTAAHCVTGLKPGTTISVVVGTTTANDTFHEGKNLSVAPPGQKFSVTTKPSICCGNNEYKSEGAAGPYDAAVLTLNQPVTFGKNVQPIDHLASPSQKDSLEAQGDKVTEAGWGLTKNCNTIIEDPKTGQKKPNPDCKPSDQLRKTEASIEEPNWWETSNGIQKEVWIKAGEKKGNGACEGDSGGPMFAGPDNKGRYTQIGIASGVLGDCGGGKGTLYTEINNPTIYNFITKAAEGNNKGNNNKGNNKGSGNNKGGGANKASGKGGGSKGGGGDKGGGSQGGDTTGGSGSTTGTDTTGTDITGSGSSTGGGTTDTGGGTTDTGGGTTDTGGGTTDTGGTPGGVG